MEKPIPPNPDTMTDEEFNEWLEAESEGAKAPSFFCICSLSRMKKCTGKSASQSPRRAHWIKPALSSELDKFYPATYSAFQK